ncbi:hypothetical protein [Sphingomonas sp.]|uniref:hypothetical protein n=1 Tax=Sphingomonas sp. TaxID=28214 RepID=UPI003CC5EB19
MTEGQRNRIAGECNKEIVVWATASTKRAFGKAFDSRSALVEQEYSARKEAIM